MSNRKTILLIAGVLLAAGAVAAVSAPGERGHRMGGMFSGWGGDGHFGRDRWSRRATTEEDFEANARARFGRIDRNGDGVVDAAEIEAALAQRMGRHERRRERMSERLLRRFDADRDGKVTHEEFVQYISTRFVEFDLNNDGRITDEDLPPAARGRGVLTGEIEGPRRGMGRRILRLLREADANKDGIITREEVMAAAEQRFALLDRNKDNALDKADTDTLRKETVDYRVQRFIHRFGADSEGRVTRDQFLAKAKERFARLDRDGDGTLSRGERGGWRMHRGGHHGWHGRGERGRGGPAQEDQDTAPATERGDAEPKGK